MCFVKNVPFLLPQLQISTDRLARLRSLLFEFAQNKRNYGIVFAEKS